MTAVDELKWVKFHPFTDKNAFICLDDAMGDDFEIVRKARASYGKDGKGAKQYYFELLSNHHGKEVVNQQHINKIQQLVTFRGGESIIARPYEPTEFELTEYMKREDEDRNLLRRLMRDEHTSPFEMVEFIFMVQVPMDCWRQWIRHRTANVNEYSTRYMEALDFFQVTDPKEWRLQATDNKQGSSGFLEEWPDKWKTEEADMYYTPQHPISTTNPNCSTPGIYLSSMEEDYHRQAKLVYRERLEAGVAREQARKDLPLSTYTRAYWKCDLHNIFNFLRLRMHNHAQLEIRQFANKMYDIVKHVCPVATQAFTDYTLEAKKFSKMELEVLHRLIHFSRDYGLPGSTDKPFTIEKPRTMTEREWKDFLAKIK